ncbi:MAG: hypothetical protein OXR66_03545 [Candidatus Woesearchaeota archaeon]|nr:hypothetical protein [Candidatus Woesearchaeota archaeon]
MSDDPIDVLFLERRRESGQYMHEFGQYRDPLETEGFTTDAVGYHERQPPHRLLVSKSAFTPPSLLFKENVILYGDIPSDQVNWVGFPLDPNDFPDVSEHFETNTSTGFRALSQDPTYLVDLVKILLRSAT